MHNPITIKHKLLFILISLVAFTSCESEKKNDTESSSSSPFQMEEDQYVIQAEFIKGKSNIDQFTIAELSGDKFSEEKLRVCCESKGDSLIDKIFFNKKNEGYHWYFCTLDLSFIEDDSLKDLTITEKIKILHNDSKEAVESEYSDIMPIKFETGKWYHFFGLENIEGSYFVHVEDNNTFSVEYFDGGPW